MNNPEKFKLDAINNPDQIREINSAERKKEIEKVVEEMRNYLGNLQTECPEVLGLLLHGSRLNQKKMPKATSDVDAILLLKEGNLTDSHLPEGRKLVEKLVSFIRAHKTESGFEVEPNDFYTVSEFMAELKSREIPKTLRGKLIWGTDPEAFEYIGSNLNDKSESEVNEFLKTELASSDMEEFKKMIAEKQKLNS